MRVVNSLYIHYLQKLVSLKPEFFDIAMMQADDSGVARISLNRALNPVFVIPFAENQARFPAIAHRGLNRSHEKRQTIIACGNIVLIPRAFL